jgi:antitoxin component YwqK of YwqJK toxin-antitoxin module
MNYINGKEEDGLYKSYHENGQLSSEENFKDGEYHGVQKFFDENGYLDWTTNYKNGEKNGLDKYFTNGKLDFIMEFKDGERIK